MNCTSFHFYFYRRNMCIFRSSRSQKFFEIGVLKNFTIFTGKHLCWSLFLTKLENMLTKLRHSVKDQDPRTRDLGTLEPGTRDPPRSLKVGPRTPLRFKSGNQGPTSKFKSGTPGPPSKFKSGNSTWWMMNSFFSKYFIFFFTYSIFLSFLNKSQKISTVSNRNQ